MALAILAGVPAAAWKVGAFVSLELGSWSPNITIAALGKCLNYGSWKAQCAGLHGKKHCVLLATATWIGTGSLLFGFAESELVSGRSCGLTSNQKCISHKNIFKFGA